MFKIFVDADSCPVKSEIIKVAERHKITVYIVSNGGLRPNSHHLVKNIYVSEGLDIADNWIEKKITSSDFLITADIPLASKCIKKNVTVLGHKGEIYNNNNIQGKLATRNLMNELRASNPFLKGSNKIFTNNDRSKFMNSFEKSIQLKIKKLSLL